MAFVADVARIDAQRASNLGIGHSVGGAMLKDMVNSKHLRSRKSSRRGRNFRDSSSDLRVTIRARWPSPGDLFAQIGEPKPVPIAVDFLIGWRVGIITEANSW